MLPGRVALLCVVLSRVVHAQWFFQDEQPQEYLERTDLSDCHQRFGHGRLDTQCLIFNGQLANVTQFPHMAVLGWLPEANENVQWKCGGSLITERFVLTAAHCTADDNGIAPRLVRLGDVNLVSTEDDQYAQQYNIVRLFRHPEHKFSRKYYDLALAELDFTVTLTLGVCPACLWPKSLLPSDHFETAGFGETSFATGPVPFLLKAYLRSVNADNCTANYEGIRGLPDGIKQDQLCAANTQMDTCQGDSGGPLQVHLYSYDHQLAFVVGVTSFGRGCGMGSSGVYQLVSEHIDWIETVTNDTMNPIKCWEKYEQYTQVKSLKQECTMQDAYISRVKLRWNVPIEGNTCAGTLIDYNTVITTAHCTFGPNGTEPTQIEVSDDLIDIVQIERHPMFHPDSYEHDLALLRLRKYVKARLSVRPSCLSTPQTNARFNPQVSIRIPAASGSPTIHMYKNTRHRCDSKRTEAFNHTGMDCWNADHRVVPGLANVELGAGLLDATHANIYGINTYAVDFGSTNLLYTTDPNRYVDWITKFILDQTKTAIQFEQEPDELFGRKCKTMNGAEGTCVLDLICGEEIKKHQSNGNSQGLSLCGFKGFISYICCPKEHLNRPLLVTQLPDISVA